VSSVFELRAEDLSYLEDVEHKAFAPVGWLYRGVYEGLARRGLVFERADGFRLTEFGREQLGKLRVIQ